MYFELMGDLNLRESKPLDPPPPAAIVDCPRHAHLIGTLEWPPGLTLWWDRPSRDVQMVPKRILFQVPFPWPLSISLLKVYGTPCLVNEMLHTVVGVVHTPYRFQNQNKKCFWVFYPSFRILVVGYIVTPYKVHWRSSYLQEPFTLNPCLRSKWVQMEGSPGWSQYSSVSTSNFLPGNSSAQMRTRL